VTSKQIERILVSQKEVTNNGKEESKKEESHKEESQEESQEEKIA
jgi:hypothetical protein